MVSNLRLCGLVIVLILLPDLAIASAGNTPQIESQPPKIDFLVDQDMHDFLVQHGLFETDRTGLKISRLLEGLFGPEGDDFKYVRSLTIPPSEAFKRREGNCISFAMLFATLGRAAGLDVQFNQIDFSPALEKEGDIVFENGHINTVIKTKNRKYVIEWIDYYREIANRSFNPISDDTAISHFYNNLGMIALSKEEHDKAKVMVEAALELDDQNPSAWQNYGIYWQKQRDYGQMEHCLLKAADCADDRSSVYFVLSEFYRLKGDAEEAALWNEKGKSYQRKNPFYYRHLALIDYNHESYTSAVKNMKRAIRLLPGYDQFVLELAACYHKRGKGSWESSVRRAQKYAISEHGRDSSYVFSKDLGLRHDLRLHGRASH
jgi:tetratricopeptide (TPR) repeat protein